MTIYSFQNRTRRTGNETRFIDVYRFLATEKMGAEGNKSLDEQEEKEQEAYSDQIEKQAQENIAYLMAAKTELLSLSKMNKTLDSLKAEEKRLQKSIASEEKSMEDEITQTIHRKLDEIENQFESALKDNKEKEKRLLTKRAKKKNEKVKERVKEETADVREENRKLKTEMDSLFKQNHIPRFCNSKLYYSLFMTKGIFEVLEFLATIFICIIVIPALLCIAAEDTVLSHIKDLKPYYIIIFLACTLLFFFVYIIILNSTKVKHHPVLVEGRKIRDKVKANEKKIKAITNAVKKDKDESQYNLEKYDEKLEEIREEARIISEKRQTALTEFEQKGKQEITESIRNRRREGLETIKQKYRDHSEQLLMGEKNIQEQKRLIQENYTKRIGDEYMDYETITDLITIIEEGDADSVEEAILFYNNE